MSSIFGGSTRSHRTSSHKSSSHPLYSRPSASRSAPIFRTTSPHKPSSSSRGLFSSFTSSGGHKSSTSSYRRRPREGYVAYLWAKLRRLLLDLWRYFRRHPVKAFVAVVVPLLSVGGGVAGLLRAAGVSVPLLGAMGGRGGGGSGGGYYGSQGYDEPGGGGADIMGSLGSVVKIAQAFI